MKEQSLARVQYEMIESAHRIVELVKNNSKAGHLIETLQEMCEGIVEEITTALREAEVKYGDRLDSYSTDRVYAKLGRLHAREHGPGSYIEAALAIANEWAYISDYVLERLDEKEAEEVDA